MRRKINDNNNNNNIKCLTSLTNNKHLVSQHFPDSKNNNNNRKLYSYIKLYGKYFLVILSRSQPKPSQVKPAAVTASHN